MGCARAAVSSVQEPRHDAVRESGIIRRPLEAIVRLPVQSLASTYPVAARARAMALAASVLLKR